ncbi:MAG: zinc metalloprotease [Bacteroidota bacterium]
MIGKFTLLFVLLSFCASAQKVYRIPVVVHVLHLGDVEGTGSNFSNERIIGQIKSLNEDFRRKQDTPGFNNHPDGADSNIEFVLAEIDPEGHPTNGIVRVDMTKVQPPSSPGDVVTLCSQYSYWDPNKYLNIWCMAGLPPGLLLGSSRFPKTDLDGLKDLGPQPDGDGVFINAMNFGSGSDNVDPNYNMGRTLTHEVGHFLGLLHTFGSVNNSRQCDAYTDYCDDTPSISVATNGCPPVIPTSCDGRPVMIGNYMDGSYDACMNIFTNDQVARMRRVLEDSPQRASLTTSVVIDRSGEVTGIDDPTVTSVNVYPNPASEKLFVSLNGYPADVGAYRLSGQTIFKENVTGDGEVEIPVERFKGEVIVVIVTRPERSYRFLVVVR